MAGVLTRYWEALEMAHTIAQHGQITVTGEVELTDTGTTAELKEHAPPSTDSKMLLLDLVIHRHGGFQGHVAWFETLTFKMKSSSDSYNEIAILYGGEIVRRVKVEHRSPSRRRASLHPPTRRSPNPERRPLLRTRKTPKRAPRSR